MNKPKIYWLVSYPKSGNTWCRTFLSNYMNKGEKYISINQLDHMPVASSRFFVDNLLGLESSELTADEIAEFRLEAFKIIQRESEDIRIIKVHDAYPEQNEPNFFTEDITAGVIYIVRNPLDVAVSLAYHLNESIDSSIHHINDEHFSFCNDPNKLEIQFPQKLGSWSGHVKSWIYNYKGNFHLIRFEDLLDKPHKTFKELIDFLHFEFNEESFQRSMDLSNFNFLREQEKRSGFKEKSPKTKSFFREGKAGTWKKHLKKDQIKRIVNYHNEIMTTLKYLDKNGTLLA